MKPSPATSSSTNQKPNGDPERRFRNLYGLERFVWGGRMTEAFWTTASLISLAINIFLIAIIFLMARYVFTLQYVFDEKLVTALYKNFVLMDDAHIITTIQVSDTIKVEDNIPVVFDLPLQQETQVVLTRDTPVRNATIFLNGAAVPIDIILRQGTPLNIALDLVVPVNQTIPVVLNVPVNLTVPVDIPLNETDLHAPFAGLQVALGPTKELLALIPKEVTDLPVCTPLTDWFCEWFFIPSPYPPDE